jgi:peroxiredoxin
MTPVDPAPRRLSPVLALLIFLTVLAALAGGWRWLQNRERIRAQSRPTGSELSQGPAPEFALANLEGQTVRLADYRGQVVLLNFWATWCTPCEAEMPDLNALYLDQGEKHDFVVVAINKGEDAATVRPFVMKRHLAFPVLLDETGDVSVKRFAVRVLPMSLIIDREGVIRDAWYGQIAREAMLKRLERVW